MINLNCFSFSWYCTSIVQIPQQIEPSSEPGVFGAPDDGGHWSTCLFAVLMEPKQWDLL